MLLSTEKEGRGLEKTTRRPRFVLRRNKYLALEDIQALLGLTHEELVSLFTLLEKAEYGSLEFHVGNIRISFRSYGHLSSDFSASPPVEIDVEAEIKYEDSARIAKYTFEHGLKESQK